MQIQGVWGDQAGQLAPEQRINVWESSRTGLEFYDTRQVAELGDLATEDYLLEPIEDGSTLRPEVEAIAPAACPRPSPSSYSTAA